MGSRDDGCTLCRSLRSLWLFLWALSLWLIYSLGLFHGSTGELLDLSEEEAAALEVEEAVACGWDIIYDVWQDVQANGGRPCSKEDPFTECCNDMNCAGFLRHSGGGSQCYHFGELPGPLLRREWDDLPLELFDKSRKSKWSFFAKRTLKSDVVQGLVGGEETAHDSDDIHVVFTCDCRPFNLWQHELLFHSAVSVEQPGYITAIISGCSDSQMAHLQERHKTLAWPERFTQYFVKKFNDAKSFWLSKPYGFKQWFHDRGPSSPVLALLDPDMAFLRPLTAKLDVSTAPKRWEGPLPNRVQKGTFVAQRYGNLGHFDDENPFLLSSIGVRKPEDMSDEEFLNWVCTGDKNRQSGCSGITMAELSTFHSAGVPYMGVKEDWAWMAEDWASVNERLYMYTSQGFYIDMFSWTLAAAAKGKRQLLLENLMLSSAVNPHEDWRAVDALATAGLNVDVCHTNFDEVLSHLVTGRSKVQALPGQQVASLIHYCLPIGVPYPSFKDQDNYRLWSKYWFDWGGAVGKPHIFERCHETAAAHRQGAGFPFGPALTWFLKSPPLRFEPNSSMEASERRNRFLGCAAKGLFRKAAQALCPRQPLAKDLLEPTAPLDE